MTPWRNTTCDAPAPAAGDADGDVVRSAMVALHAAPADADDDTKAAAVFVASRVLGVLTVGG